MIITSIRFKSIKIAKYAKDSADIKIYYDTGDEKALCRSITFGNSEALAEEIFNEVREMEKRPSRNMREMDTDGILEGTVVVRFFEEEKSREKMKNFLDRISEKAKDIRTKRDCTGYLDMINRFHMLEFRFD